MLERDLAGYFMILLYDIYLDPSIAEKDSTHEIRNIVYPRDCPPIKGITEHTETTYTALKSNLTFSKC